LTNLELLSVMKTDIKLIDEQHMSLLNLIRDFDEAIINKKGKTAIGKTLNEIMNYISHHFRAEEELMIRHNYPGFYEHKKQHDDLFKKAIKYQEKYKEGIPKIEIEISAFLTDWVVNHINKSDIEYVPNVTGI